MTSIDSHHVSAIWTAPRPALRILPLPSTTHPSYPAGDWATLRLSNILIQNIFVFMPVPGPRPVPVPVPVH